ncbi:DUF3581 domain-containing protein [Photobacterium sp. WH77]|uniref:DUF3581 domain-containing protein n=1 Tax=Photobacterium arenosum TaxID=2774143 RepID=A0ABR9BS83_9GAMM|nr:MULTISPECIES: DUF3581 domain-containing protein [Photobacterium]MBD8514505.1 DUF3581 domain-containing protein [Photobacterium arenosum]MBV7262365.1 DUF3581 domain-containing protein [Photobacterium sp. WH24]MCG2836257.1 DUF3581 domain-containing protein [Photobacterium sp. WH77]MCG2844116.1 DUF3581 domain-containing protein [Photobacterium sp. WH80]MDO6580543.1 DUF3581 domain-containing protein [Photobacterium sp. 2_MG-2023]
MFLDSYFAEHNGAYTFTREQASHFAKKVAGDFNPIHDADNKRFCVPGDLLFSVMLAKTGLSQKMRVEFAGMITDGVALAINTKSSNDLSLVDEKGKEYLHVLREGEVTHNASLIETVTKNYVQFSGKNFPHIMVPLMESKQVMINPARPLVIYESMELEFSRLDLEAPTVELTDSILESDGKRGSVTLAFSFTEHGEVVGEGRKRMLMSGLKPYCQNDIDDLVARFNARKEAYQAA